MRLCLHESTKSVMENNVCSVQSPFNHLKMTPNINWPAGWPDSHHEWLSLFLLNFLLFNSSWMRLNRTPIGAAWFLVSDLFKLYFWNVGVWSLSLFCYSKVDNVYKCNHIHRETRKQIKGVHAIIIYAIIIFVWT